jgi:hypothetical protein
MKVWFTVGGLGDGDHGQESGEDVRPGGRRPGLSFTAQPGRVTGFLGPNGSGKTATLRVVLGLVRPSEGEALIGGLPYHRLTRPRRTVGALLEADRHPYLTPGIRLLPQWGGGLVLLGYATVLAAVAAVTTLKRDVT